MSEDENKNKNKSKKDKANRNVSADSAAPDNVDASKMTESEEAVSAEKASNNEAPENIDTKEQNADLKDKEEKDSPELKAAEEIAEDTAKISFDQKQAGSPSKSESSANEDASKSRAHQKVSQEIRVVRYAKWPLFVLFLCVLGVAAGVGYLSLQGQQRISEQEKQIGQLKTELAQQSANYQKDINVQAEKLRTEIKRIQKNTDVFKQDLASAQQRLAAQGKRLRAMSDTSREDWLLAEAEYLLKLANQRVRIERSPQGADALISEADAILRDLDQPDLHGIRREIAEDLAALRLMQKVDVEGIYLQLVALSQNIEKLPHRQPPQKKLQSDYKEVENVDELSITQKLSNSWSRLIAELQSHVKISKHDVEIKPVLAAQDAFYLQQNLRLILERAQLALLREQQDIYTQSVNQAQAWIEKYYPESAASVAFVAQLSELADKTVAQNLPNISDSLNALHEYIEALHDLKGVAKPPAKKQDNTEL